jgi:hypothetical protein
MNTVYFLHLRTILQKRWEIFPQTKELSKRQKFKRVWSRAEQQKLYERAGSKLPKK